MPAIDYLFSSKRVRRWIWEAWYPFLTRRLAQDRVLFLNYAYEEEPPVGITLTSADEPDRASIQLYHHVVRSYVLTGKDVLEVSCGHGGGAAWLTRTFRPKRFTGLDLNLPGIRFCREQHRMETLDFIQGDAENLPLASESIDVVINVEASHCYPDLPRFFAEVARVLRPGGHFLYADFRFRDGQSDWEKALADAPFQVLRMRNINAEVLRGMALNSARSQALVERHLPRFLQAIGRDFAGTSGSRLNTGLKTGEVAYRSYGLVKPT